MKKVKVIAIALCLFAGFAITASAQDSGGMAAQKSLYDRLGGLDAIKAVVDEFATRVVGDARINAKFAKSDVPRLKLHLVEFVCNATGGPCVYTGLSMTASHKNMGVTNGEFGALVEDLGGALDKFNVGAQEKSDLVAALGPLKPQIVEVQSDATGTPLPANFKPAPPLSASQIAAGPKMKKMKKMKKSKKKSGNSNTSM